MPAETSNASVAAQQLAVAASHHPDRVFHEMDRLTPDGRCLPRIPRDGLGAVECVGDLTIARVGEVTRLRGGMLSCLARNGRTGAPRGSPGGVERPGEESRPDVVAAQAIEAKPVLCQIKPRRGQALVCA